MTLKELVSRGTLSLALALPLASVPTWPTMCPAPQVRNYREANTKYQVLESTALQSLNEFSKRDIKDYTPSTRDPFKDGSTFTRYTPNTGNKKPVDVITNAQHNITQIRLPHKFGTDISNGGVDPEILTIEQSTFPDYNSITVRAEDKYGFRLIEQNKKVRIEYLEFTTEGTKKVATIPETKEHMAELIFNLSEFLKKFPQNPKSE